MNVGEFLSAPFRAAGNLVRILGRITIGITGFVIMTGGLLLISPLNTPVAGVPVFVVGLILTVRAIF